MKTHRTVNSLALTVTVGFTLALVFTPDAAVGDDQPIRTARGEAHSCGVASILKRLGYEQIPIHGKKGRFYVDATVNDTKRSLLLDSGSAETLLDWLTATDLKLEIANEFNDVAPLGGHVRRASTHINRLEISATVVTGSEQIGVTDLSRVNADSKREGFPHLDGLLGSDQLARFSAVIDFENHHLYLLPPDKHRRMFEGDWQCEAVESNGVSELVKVTSKSSLAIRANNLVLCTDGKIVKYDFTLHVGNSPIGIELKSASANGQNTIRRGITKFDADHLVLCLAPLGSPDPPKTFSTAKTNCKTWVFKRSRSPVNKAQHPASTTPSDSIEQCLESLGYISTQMPLRADGYFGVAWTVNRCRTCVLVVDTACSNIIFDDRLAQKLNLKVYQLPPANTLGGSVQFSSSKDKVTLETGKFRTRNVKVGIFDFANFNRRLGQLGSRPIDGLVGSNALELHGAIMNCAIGKLFLWPIEKRYANHLHGEWRCVYVEEGGTRGSGQEIGAGESSPRTIASR